MTESEQAPEQSSGDSPSISLEDRVSKLFGGDEIAEQDAATSEAEAQGEQPESDAETAPQFAEVELDGKTYQVPPELKEAVIRHADYTKKTQEVADQRRQVEVQIEHLRLAQQEREFHDSIAGDVQNVALIDARMKHLMSRWNELSADEKHDLMFLDKQRQSIVGEIEGKRAQWLEGQKSAIEKLRAQALETISKSIPGWSDSLAKEIAQHAMSDGYSQQELATIMDPRHAKTLWKAMQYDKLQAEKSKAVATASKAPPIVKPGPGNRPMPPQVRDDLNLRKAQKAAKTSSEKARIIEQRLASRF